jgi:amicoumacin kinase
VKDMKHQLDAVIIRRAAALYNTTLKDLTVISEGFQNKVFSGNGFILRITSGNKKTLSMVQSEILLLRFLKGKGISVSAPLRSIHNQFLESLNYNCETYFVTAFEKAAGGPIQVQDPFQWNHRFFQRWGSLLGQVHHAGKQYSVEKFNTDRPHWSPEHPYNHDIFTNLPSEFITKKYVELIEQIRHFQRDQQHFGLIHNDFHQGNFFVDKDEITLFDFDDSAYFYFAYDIATAFYHAYWQHTSFNSAEDDFTFEFLTHFLKGYAKENSLTNELIDQLPDFLKLRELFLYVLFLKVWDSSNLQDWQDYTLNNLKTNIETNRLYAGLDDNLLTNIKKSLQKPL